MYDVAIIGGGPGGYVAAVKAAQLGLKTVLFEQERLGGVCLNKGCIPTKTLLKSAEVYHTIKNASVFGIKASGCEVDFAAVMKRKNEVVARLTSGVGALLKANGVEVVKKLATILSNSEIQAGETVYSAKNIIIASGSKPMLPPIKGIDSPSVLTSDELLSIDHIPASIVIVGGGVIGVEFAFLLSEFGCKVTIVEMLDSVIAMADADVCAIMTKMLLARGIVLICGAKVVEIGKNGLIYEKDGKSAQVEAQSVLVSVGRVPNSDFAVLDKLGIKHERGKITTDERLKTSVRGIYAIGDVNGKWMLAHKASAEGIVAVENIAAEILSARDIFSAEHSAVMHYDRIPQCIYTTPEIAWVGLTEKQARDLKLDIKCASFPMSANGKSMAEGNTTGFVKLISDAKTGELLGAHLVCAHATDMISEIVLGMNAEVCAQDIAKTIHPHPTVSESIMEAAEALIGKAIHSL